MFFKIHGKILQGNLALGNDWVTENVHMCVYMYDVCVCFVYGNLSEDWLKWLLTCFKKVYQPQHIYWLLPQRASFEGHSLVVPEQLSLNFASFPASVSYQDQKFLPTLLKKAELKTWMKNKNKTRWIFLSWKKERFKVAIKSFLPFSLSPPLPLRVCARMHAHACKQGTWMCKVKRRWSCSLLVVISPIVLVQHSTSLLQESVTIYLPNLSISYRGKMLKIKLLYRQSCFK